MKQKIITKITAHRLKKSMISRTMSKLLGMTRSVQIARSLTRAILKTIVRQHISRFNLRPALVSQNRSTSTPVTATRSKSLSRTVKRIYSMFLRRISTNSLSNQPTNRLICSIRVTPSLSLVETPILFLLLLSSWLSAAIF